MADTSIEWATKVWNPTRGCTIVSAGCQNCYAMGQAHRFSGPGKPYEGLTRLTPTGPKWTGAIRTVPEKLPEPLSWRKPERVFVNSMSDLFHADVPDSFIFEVWHVMARTPWHTYMVLTKRPERMAAWMAKLADTGPAHIEPVMYRDGQHSGYVTDDEAAAVLASGRAQMFHAMVASWGEPPPGAAAPTYDWMEGPRWWPTVLPNLWLGTSVEDQERADERIPQLLATPAAVRFVSAEPLLGPLDLGPWIYFRDTSARPRLDWVIAGGESGPGARPMHPDWVRALRDTCAQEAGTAFFFKQWGEVLPSDQHRNGDPCHELMNQAAIEAFGGTANRRVYYDDGAWGYRIGKKLAGRELDGRTWDEMPRVAVP